MAKEKVTAISNVRKASSVAGTSATSAAPRPAITPSGPARQNLPADSVEISSAGRELASQIGTDVLSVHGWRVTS